MFAAVCELMARTERRPSPICRESVALVPGCPLPAVGRLLRPCAQLNSGSEKTQSSNAKLLKVRFGGPHKRESLVTIRAFGIQMQDRPTLVTLVPYSFTSI